MNDNCSFCHKKIWGDIFFNKMPHAKQQHILSKKRPKTSLKGGCCPGLLETSEFSCISFYKNFLLLYSIQKSKKIIE